MADEIRKLTLPGEKRPHSFCSVEENGKEFWVDLTDARRKRSWESAHLYRLEDGELIFDHYRRVSLLRKEGVV